jgi:CBS domain-containing protein
MPNSIREVMTPNPISLPLTSMVTDAAKKMREADIGNVIVVDGNKVCGIITDRDIVVRAIADGRDPARTQLKDIYTENPTTMSPDARIDEAVKVMRDKKIRRLPVVEAGKPIGIVSLGDLAVDGDGETALADISKAPPNN